MVFPSSHNIDGYEQNYSKSANSESNISNLILEDLSIIRVKSCNSYSPPSLDYFFLNSQIAKSKSVTIHQILSPHHHQSCKFYFRILFTLNLHCLKLGQVPV